jgi:hypothetical protein
VKKITQTLHHALRAMANDAVCRLFFPVILHQKQTKKNKNKNKETKKQNKQTKEIKSFFNFSREEDIHVI